MKLALRLVAYITVLSIATVVVFATGPCEDTCDSNYSACTTQANTTYNQCWSNVQQQSNECTLMPINLGKPVRQTLTLSLLIAPIIPATGVSATPITIRISGLAIPAVTVVTGTA